MEIIDFAFIKMCYIELSIIENMLYRRCIDDRSGPSII